MSDAFEVPEPILNSPLHEPAEHWHIVEGETPERPPGRRPAVYYYRDPKVKPADGKAAEPHAPLHGHRSSPMLSQPLPRLALGLVLVLLAAPLAGAQPDKPAFTGPPAEEELKLLEPLVGKWQTESEIKPSLRVKEGFTSKGELTATWVHNGHFLRLEWYGISKHGRFEASEMIGYDPRTKRFRRFAFTTDGVAAESVGEWDAKTRTMTWQGVNLPAGWTAMGKLTLEKDRLVSSLLIKNERDEVYREASGTARKK